MEINSNRQNHALVILTIGTAILGIGLFQVDFASGNVLSKLWTYISSNGSFPVSAYLAIMKLILVVIVAGHYFAMFLHVMRIMRQTSYVTGRQLTNGPLFHLGVEIWFLVTIFAVDVVQKSVSVSLP